MDLKQLKYFVQIVESGSLSSASQLLNVAQPSLSQQVRTLEEELGVDLLIRHPRGVRTTELGQRFYDHARRILQESEVAKEAIRSQVTNPSGRVSVGLPTSACRGLSMPLFNAVRQKQPNIVLHLVEAVTSHLDDYIHSGGIDVALLYDHKPFEHVSWTEAIQEDLMLFVAPSSPLAKHASISFSELFDTPLVLPGRRNDLRQVMEQVAAKQDGRLKVLDCDSFTAITNLVCSGAYAAVMPHFAFMDEIARNLVVPIPIVDPTPSWRLSVVVSPRTLNQRGSAAVATIMGDVISGLIDDRTWQARRREPRHAGSTGRHQS